MIDDQPDTSDFLFAEEDTVTVSPVDAFCQKHQILVTVNEEGEYAATKKILVRASTKLQAVHGLARSLKLSGVDDLLY